MILGCHIFDMVRMLVGTEPEWCTARILQGGKEVTPADIREQGQVLAQNEPGQKLTEAIGPLIGDEINAQFSFGGGVHVSYTSRHRQEGVSALGISFRLIGSKGVARMEWGLPPRLYVLQREDLKEEDAGFGPSTDRWVPIVGDPTGPGDDRPLGTGEETMGDATERLVSDWLRAIEEDREPFASASNGAKAIEMICAVFEAGLTRERVAMPLVNREHPLAR